ncbi:MAG: hypothetical protein IPM48_14455 [Saprospiraceae bacterium]|nr:hypothetical protein [Saprospiraceae bacterium]
MKHLIIGNGEIGKALFKVLERYEPKICDTEGIRGKFDVLHVAFPYSDSFVGSVLSYKKRFGARLVIIHSTVKVGTTGQIGEFCVHSPVRGVHPNLAEGIMTFVKHFGGEMANEASKIFEDVGVETRVHENPETTEMMKILDTTYYGWNILFMKEVKRICDEYGLDFNDVYTVPNEEYNEGYMLLGKPNVRRPVLEYMEGKIGGHCVINNTFLFDDWLTNTLKERNNEYGG